MYDGIGGIGAWQAADFQTPSESLRLAFVKPPYMKLFVASGYYDLATSCFATQYTLNHMNLDSQQHAKITLGYDDARHMMYLRSDSLDRLKQDVSGFPGHALQ